MMAQSGIAEGFGNYQLTTCKWSCELLLSYWHAGRGQEWPWMLLFWLVWVEKKKKKKLDSSVRNGTAKSSNVKFKTESERVVSGTSCFHTVWLLFCYLAVITSVQIHSILLTKWLVKFYKCGNKAKKEQKHKQSGKFSQMKKMKPNSRIVPKLSITADRLAFQPLLIPQMLSFCVEPSCVVQKHNGLLCEQRTAIRVRIRRLDVI